MTKWQERQTVFGNKIGALLGRNTDYLDSGKLRITANFNKSLHSWVRDGQDHINASVHGTTETGFKLAFAAKNIIRHPLLGGFASLQNMLMWSIIRYHPDADSIRWVSGSQRIPVYIKLVSDCERIGCVQTAPVNKVAIAATHIIDLLTHDKGLMDEFMRIDIPYDSYLTSASGLRYRDDYTAPAWYLNTLDVIQKHVVFDGKPGFPDLNLFVKSGNTESIYDEIMPAYQLDAVLRQRELAKKEKEEAEPKEVVVEQSKKISPSKKRRNKQKRRLQDLENSDKINVALVLDDLDKRATAIEVGTTLEDPAPLSNEDAKAFAEVFVDHQSDQQEQEFKPEVEIKPYLNLSTYEQDHPQEAEAYKEQPVQENEQQSPQ